MKVLIILGPTLADAVFSTPIIRALKVQWEDVQLHVLADISYAFVLNENPYVDNIHFDHSSLWKNFRRLKKKQVDLIVNLRGDLESKCLTFLLHKKTYSLKSIRQKLWLMVNLKINHLSDTHLVDRMFENLKALKIKPDELGLDYFIPERDKVPKTWLPHEFQHEYVAFCINASHNTRKLSLSRMVELCDKINKPVVLLGMKEDEERGESVRSFFNDQLQTWDKEIALHKHTTIYNACGKFNFNQMASVIKQAKVVFTFDNDFVPIASAFRKEIFGLWGNTITSFGRYPYRTRFTILENSSLSCRPCSAKGCKKCPLGHFRCMNEIVFDFYLP